jgi:hypothetical protein
VVTGNARDMDLIALRRPVGKYRQCACRLKTETSRPALNLSRITENPKLFQVPTLQRLNWSELSPHCRRVLCSKKVACLTNLKLACCVY